MNTIQRLDLLAPISHYRSIPGLLTEWDFHDPRNGGIGLADADGITICENLADPRRAFYDPFTRGDSATTMGTDWEVLAGTWGITSNQAYLVTATGADYVVRNSGLSDCVVSATLATYALSSRLSFRFSDVDNGYIIEPSATKYELYKRETASFSLLGSYVAAPVNGDRIRVVLTGSSINVFFNGTSRISVTNTFNQTATKHGFGGNTNSVAGRWDDFIVAKLTDLVQSTASQKLAYQLNIKNAKAVGRATAASSQRMQTATFATAIAQPFTVVVAGKFGGNAQTLIDGIGSSNQARIGAEAGGWTINGGTAISGGTTDTNYHVFVATFNGASSELRVDGTQEVSGDAGAQSLTGSTIAANQALGSFLDGDELLALVYQGTLSESQKRRVELHYGRRYDIAIA